jgi:hypothetical protein
MHSGARTSAWAADSEPGGRVSHGTGTGLRCPLLWLGLRNHWPYFGNCKVGEMHHTDADEAGKID